jgi:hypothetical protein
MNGPSSTTSSEIPEEWKPYINQVVANAGQVMEGLPLFSGGPPAGSGTPGAGGGGDSSSGGVRGNHKEGQVRGGGDSGGGDTRPPATARDGGSGRVVPDVPIGGGSQPGGSYGPFVPYGSTGPGWDPSQGILSWNPQEVAGPSGLENYAAGNVVGLGDETAGGAKAAEYYTQGAAPVSGKSIAGTELFNSANKMFEDQILGTIQNSKSLGGLDAGTGQASAIGAGKAQYLMPLMSQVMSTMEGDAGRSLNAGSGFAGLGRDESAREFGEIEAAMNIGGVGREIRNQRNRAEREEFNRLAGIGERVSLGPLASVLPASIGSTTTSSKF